MKDLTLLVVLIWFGCGTAGYTGGPAESCETGWACFEAGKRFFAGNKPAAGTTHADLGNAADLFIRACELRERRGCNSAGNMYRAGLGVEMDLHLARHYYRLACADDYPEACYNLQRVERVGKRRAPSVQAQPVTPPDVMLSPDITLGRAASVAVIEGPYSDSAALNRAKKGVQRSIGTLMAPGFPVVAHAEQFDLPAASPFVLVLAVFDTEDEAKGWLQRQRPSARVARGRAPAHQGSRVVVIRPTTRASVFSAASVLRRIGKGCSERLDRLCALDPGTVFEWRPTVAELFGWWVPASCDGKRGYVRKSDTLNEVSVRVDGETVEVTQRVAGACDMSDFIKAKGSTFDDALPTVEPSDYCSFDVPNVSGCL